MLRLLGFCLSGFGDVAAFTRLGFLVSAFLDVSGFRSESLCVHVFRFRVSGLLRFWTLLGVSV